MLQDVEELAMTFCPEWQPEKKEEKEVGGDKKIYTREAGGDQKIYVRPIIRYMRYIRLYNLLRETQDQIAWQRVPPSPRKKNKERQLYDLKYMPS